MFISITIYTIFYIMPVCFIYIYRSDFHILTSMTDEP